MPALQPARDRAFTASSACRNVAARATATVADLKAELQALAGPNGGLDKSPQEKEQVLQFVKKLEAISPPKPAERNLTDTTWKLLFTDSEGQSAGKVGPFVGQTLQVFPADKPGSYINSLEFANGFIRIELTGVFEPNGAESKVELEFKHVRLLIGGAQVLKKDFPPAFRGFWRCTYADGDLRIFYSNKDNLFVLRKVSS